MPAGAHFALCTPRFFGVAYVINPWMEGNVGRGDAARALEQWEGLRRVLAAHATLALVDPVEGLPDMPFTANAGLAHGHSFVPARPRFPQRQPEIPYFTEWFRRNGYRIVELPRQATFEGEGDALFQPAEPLLWGGYGVRTSLEAHVDLAEVLDVEVVPLRLVDERFYHLDTCFCPLPGGRVLYYPDAFDRDSVATIHARIPAQRRLEVDATDALHFACNAVVTEDGVLVTNFAGPALRERLEHWGFTVALCPLDEFILAGGAAKCLALRLAHPGTVRPSGTPRVPSPIRERIIEVEGHLLDTNLMNTLLDRVTDAGGSFEVLGLHPGFRHDQPSRARLRVLAPSPARLETILVNAVQLGARAVEAETDARLAVVVRPGVAPEDFYSTTIYPTDVRIAGRWLRVERQRMDGVLLIEGEPNAPAVACRLIRDLRPGDHVVTGIEGVRTHPGRVERTSETFGFMGAEVSSERRVELAVERVAWDMRRIRERSGRIVVVAGPVVVHTGGARHVARLVRAGYVQALLGGNGLAAHDIEHALFGTSLGVDLKRGLTVQGGHRHHLLAINLVRAHGGIAAAVAAGAIGSGIFYEAVRAGVPFALAGSIRDDGPLPDTIMDLIAAQEAYARLIAGADMILMLSSMLHAIGVGNMTPAGVRLICVDISPAVVTKLADRGSLESTGIVTDVGLFLNLLDRQLLDEQGG